MPRVDATRLLLLLTLLVVSTILYKQSDVPVPSSGHGPGRSIIQPRIAMISMTTREQSYDHIAMSSKIMYAERHNYKMLWDFHGPRGVWDKLSDVAKIVKEDKYDWIWWLDYDILITNTSVKLENIIADALSEVDNPDEIDMILTPDCFPLNTGSMLFRSTPWVVQIVDRCEECGKSMNKDGGWPSEQDCLRDVIAANTLRAKDKSISVRQWKLNAFPDEIGCYDERDRIKWEKGMFVIHFAGAWAHVKEDDPVGLLMRRYHPEVVHE